MKQIVQHLRSGRLEVLETPVPIVRNGCLLVRTTRSAISPGTERQMLRWGQQSLLGKARSRPDLVRLALSKVRRDGWLPTLREAFARMDAPRPLGYSSAGVVQAVGEGVVGYRPGDRVACAGAGFANHAEQVCVPHNLVAPIPDGVTDEEAAFTMLAAIALRGLQRGEVRSGDQVAIVGLGLLGQLAAQLATASGARVLACDVDAGRVELARQMGAEAGFVVGRDDPAAAVRAFASGTGCDAVIVAAASSTSEPLVLAAELARRGGRVVVVGLTGMTVPREAYWKKELDLRLSRAAGPGSEEPVFGPRDDADPRWTVQRNLAACLELLAAGRVRVAPLITHRFGIDEADEAYRLVGGMAGTPSLGVVLRYGNSPQPQPAAPAAPPARAETGVVRVGVIGAGLFARATLLPELRRLPGVEVAAIASARGLSAQEAAGRFGPATAATDAEEILTDGRIAAVLIATRHDQHAVLAMRALRAGKHVFVEKPPAMSVEELGGLLQTAKASSAVFLVGYNRRFAPLVRALQAALPDAPLLVTCRVNAGRIPAEHWVHDHIEGGGRLFSETCHFVDLIQCLTAARPVRVAAHAAGGRTDVAAYTVVLDDGSVGVVSFTGAGARAFSRERIEVFGPDIAAALEDFRRLEIVRGGRRLRQHTRGAPHGYREELAAWVGAIRGTATVPPPEVPLLATLATLQAVRSLQTGLPELVELAMIDGTG